MTMNILKSVNNNVPLLSSIRGIRKLLCIQTKCEAKLTSLLDEREREKGLKRVVKKEELKKMIEKTTKSQQHGVTFSTNVTVFVIVVLECILVW